MKKSSFTILELLIYLSIISIIFCICIFHFDIINKYKTKKEISELVSDMDYYRNYSLIEKEEIEFYFDFNKNIYKIRFPNRNENKLIKEESFKYIILKKKLGDSSTGDSYDRLFFKKSGAVNRGVTYNVFKSQNTLDIYAQITITPVTGRIKLEYV